MFLLEYEILQRELIFKKSSGVDIKRDKNRESSLLGPGLINFRSTSGHIRMESCRKPIGRLNPSHFQ